MSDSIEPAVLESPRELTQFSQLSFEVIAGDYSRPGNQPANYTLVKGRREALLVDVPLGRADAHRLIARILDTGLKLHTIFITHDQLDHFFSLDLLTETFPKAAVVAHSVVAADIKRSISLKFDGLAESERMGANGPWRGVVPTPLCIDHMQVTCCTTASSPSWANIDLHSTMHGWRASTISSRCDRNGSSPVIPSLVFPTTTKRSTGRAGTSAT